MAIDEGEDLRQVQAEMHRRVGGEVFFRQAKQPHRRVQAAAIRRMIRPGALFLQMDEGAGELDESLEKGVVAITSLQPEMLEDVMRLVVLLGVEAGEITEIARIIFRPVQPQGLHKGFHALGFFRRLRGHDGKVRRRGTRCNLRKRQE